MVKVANNSKTNLYILSPNIDDIFSTGQIKQLGQLTAVYIEKQPKAFKNVPGLYTSNYPKAKIIALDPDFCAWNMPDQAILNIPQLKAICLQTVSYDWLNTKLAKKKHISVTNLPGFSSRSAAEYELLIAMTLARQLPLVANDHWSNDFNKYKGSEMLGKTAGIIGMGALGSHLAQICQSLDMKVIYWSRKARNKTFRYVSLLKLLQESDFIFSAIPDNQRTKRLFPRNILRKISRGEIVISAFKCALNDSPYLTHQARNRKISGYGFETDNKNRGFIKSGNILALPNLAWNTDNSKQRNSQQWFESIQNAINDKYPNRVN